MNRTYRSKVDTWMVWILILGVGLSFGVVVLVAFTERKFHLIPIGLITPIVVRFAVWPMEYTLEKDRIVVRSGFIRQIIRYEEIRSVEPTRSPLSAPALSLDRLNIRRKRGSGVMISPENREAFLRELAESAKLDRRGDTLERAGSER